MTTITTPRPVSMIPTITNPCGEADLLEKLQAQSRRIMVVDVSTSPANYAIVTHWDVAHQLVDGILSAYCKCTALRHQPLTALEADVLSQIVIEERPDLVLLAGARAPSFFEHNSAAMINHRTQVPVLHYAS